jgi:polyisoprenoid-binding protein YceI
VTRYDIVPEQSTVTFDARSSLHPIHSSTDGLEGYVDLEFGPDGDVDLTTTPAAELSLPVRRLSSGNALEDRELQRRIDARRFPTITGALREVVPTGADANYRMSGEVTFRGVARHYQDEMTIQRIDDETVKLTGRSRFDIRDFGMEPPRILMLRVEPEVDVNVEIIARKEI